MNTNKTGTHFEPNTHLKIDQSLCGIPVAIDDTGSKVTLTTTKNMAADEKGLIHGGFVFGLADYAAMVAVNHPNVVLGGADVKFIKPVRVGEQLTATAEILPEQGKKKPVRVRVNRGDDLVFDGEFVCFVLEKHVLES